jgi:hypothetical protein
MSPVKEPGYFFLEEGKPLTRPGKIAKNFTYWKLDDYLSLFNEVTTETAIGEATTFYFYIEDAAKRIHATIPHCRLIAILRNPVDRAFSDYMLHYGLLEIEPLDDFHGAILAELNQPDHFTNWWDERRYVNAGLYYTHISRYLEIFDSSQIKILLFDDFKQNTPMVLKEIFRFLGVDEEFVPDTKFQYNTSGIPQNALIHDFATKPNQLTDALRKVVPESFKTKVMGVLQRINYEKPQMDDATREFLGNIFREEILKLQDIIDADLSDWLD